MPFAIRKCTSPASETRFLQRHHAYGKMHGAQRRNASLVYIQNFIEMHFLAEHVFFNDESRRHPLHYQLEVKRSDILLKTCSHHRTGGFRNSSMSSLRFDEF